MITKEKLAELHMVYAINIITINNKDYCIAASENRDGKLLLVDLKTKEVRELEGLKGGVMNVIPIPEVNGGFFAIQGFYPIFDSKEAEIVKCVIPNLNSAKVQLSVERIKKLPYVHRIELVGEQTSRKIIAATLCRDKAFVEDWTHPGDVYEIYLDTNLEVKKCTQIMAGIFKNHGLFKRKKDNEEQILISGNQGVCNIHVNQSEINKIISYPVSDIYTFDIDNDGTEELICISPFHGDDLKVFKRYGKGWEEIFHEKINFGHAIWCGNINSKTILISCSRGGNKNIDLYILEWDGKYLRSKKEIVDENTGTSNIVVKEYDNKIELFAANHASNNVFKYTIS